MWNLFARKRYLLHRTLSPETCAARLRTLIVSWRDGGAWVPFATDPNANPLQGRVSPDGFSIRNLVRYQNSFQTEAPGRFAATPSGTSIDVTIGLGRWTVLIGTLWAAGVLLIGVLLLVLLIVRPDQITGPSGVRMLIPFAMLMAFTALVLCGRWLARDKETLLL